MKTTVINAITEVSSKNFERKVSQLLPKGVTDIHLSHCGMRRASGYGSYYYVLDISINKGEFLTLKQHTNDAPSWDAYHDLEYGSRALDNFKKNVALSLLEDCKDRIEQTLLNDIEDEE